MFAMQRDRSSSGSSTRSTSSSRSLSLSPHGGWNPTRAVISPATATTSPLSSSPVENNDFLAPLPSKQAHNRPGNLRRLEAQGSDSQFSSYAFPSWPVGDSLSYSARDSSSSHRHRSAYTSYNTYATNSSLHIPDDELAELDFSRPRRREETVQEIGQIGISWSQVGTGAVVAQAHVPERKKRGPPPGALILEGGRSSSGSVGKRSRMSTRTRST